MGSNGRKEDLFHGRKLIRIVADCRNIKNKRRIKGWTMRLQLLNVRRWKHNLKQFHIKSLLEPTKDGPLS